MDKYYKIMADLLNSEYEIKAAVSILEVLEAAYSEETHFEIKAIITVIKRYLKTVRLDIREIIDYIDILTSEVKKGN